MLVEVKSKSCIPSTVVGCSFGTKFKIFVSTEPDVEGHSGLEAATMAAMVENGGEIERSANLITSEDVQGIIAPSFPLGTNSLIEANNYDVDLVLGSVNREAQLYSNCDCRIFTPIEEMCGSVANNIINDRYCDLIQCEGVFNATFEEIEVVQGGDSGTNMELGDVAFDTPNNELQLAVHGRMNHVSVDKIDGGVNNSYERSKELEILLGKGLFNILGPSKSVKLGRIDLVKRVSFMSDDMGNIKIVKDIGIVNSQSGLGRDGGVMSSNNDRALNCTRSETIFEGVMEIDRACDDDLALVANSPLGSMNIEGPKENLVHPNAGSFTDDTNQPIDTEAVFEGHQTNASSNQSNQVKRRSNRIKKPSSRVAVNEDFQSVSIKGKKKIQRGKKESLSSVAKSDVIAEDCKKNVKGLDASCHNKMLRREAEKTLEVGRLLGISFVGNEDDLIKKLMDLEAEEIDGFTKET